jgi:NTE family protein
MLFKFTLTTDSWLLITAICLGLVIGCLSPGAPAREEITPRPKIGLALSGGGARGMAHIGVLKALEELQVPIDYLAGTSMGSIIGGLYASGMTIEELREAVGNLDWKKLLMYQIDRNQLSYRDKQTQRRYFNFEFGLNESGLTIPSGIISGQDLLLFFKRITKNINIDDFAKLPIPFKAVATNIENPNAPSYLLDKGDLAMALRASMAVPFAFAPVTVDGHLLVDGGIIDNLPVDVVKNMGADIVIGVDIATPLLNQIDSSSSLLTVAKQAMDISLVQNALQARKQANILIEPNLKGLTLTDFDKSAAMIASGYQAVMEKRHLFKTLSVSKPAYAKYRAAKQARIPLTFNTITPAFVKIEGNYRTNIESLQSKLNRLIGQKLRLPKDLEEVADQLMSLKEFEQVNYRLQRDMQGATGLIFEVREKPWGPHYFRLGVNAATSFADKIQFTLLAHHEKLNINRLGAEWVNELEVGTGYLFRTEFYQPLDYDRHFFIAPFATVERSFPEVFKQQHGIASYDIKNWQVGVEVGMNFGNQAELRGGIQQNHTNARLRIGDSATLPTGQIQENLLTFKFGYDNLDDKVFVTQGLKINLDGHFYHKAIGSDLNYQQATFYARQHSPLLPSIILVSDLTWATSFNSTPPEYQNFSVGGVDLLSGYPTNEIAGRQALVMRLGGLIDSSYLPKFGATDTRLLALIHAGNVWDRFSEIDVTNLRYGGTAAIVWDTQFGTIRLGTGYTDGGSFRYNLSLGSFF